MKLADLDWNEVLAVLPAWEAMSPDARLAFIKMKPGGGAAPAILGRAAGEMVAAGLASPPPPRGFVYAHQPGARPLLLALRSMERARPLDESRKFSPEAYLQDQMPWAESVLIAADGSYRAFSDRSGAVARAFSVEWVKRFLAADTPEKIRDWERPLLTTGEPPRLSEAPVALALRALVQALAEEPHVRSLGSLAQVAPHVAGKHLVRALEAGLRYLLLFVSLRGEAPEAVLGLLPSVARRMGPPLPAPPAVPVRETFEAPFRVADMTAVLVEASAEPIPVRGDDRRLYVRAEKALAARIMRLPAWTAGLTDVRLYGFAPAKGTGDEAEGEEESAARAAVRLHLAIDALHVLGLARRAETSGRYRLEATKAGREWLALPDGERLRHVVRRYRESTQRVPEWSTPEGEMDFFGTHLPFSLHSAIDLRTPLSAAFLSLPDGGLVPLHPFIQHQAETENPFLAENAERLRSHVYYGGGRPTRERWELLWTQVLGGFLRMRLVPLGGARLGRMEDGELAFALTDAGRYLLGGVDDFTPPAPSAAEVVVQPDFEVVFLAPSPQAEAELARFADRTGSGVGALFRLTRASILRAAEVGLTAEKVLKTLGGLSRTPVPANVARQVRDWFGATRRVKVAATLLVECPDSETAARVLALAGSQAKAVTRTLLRFDGSKKEVAALAKKLKAKGIFLEG